MKRSLWSTATLVAFAATVPMVAGAGCGPPQAPRPPIDTDPVEKFVEYCEKVAKDPRLGCGACVALADCGYCFSDEAPLEGQCMYTKKPGEPSIKCEEKWAQNDTMCPMP